MGPTTWKTGIVTFLLLGKEQIQASRRIAAHPLGIDTCALRFAASCCLHNYNIECSLSGKGGTILEPIEERAASCASPSFIRQSVRNWTGH